jgi:hypothetical protein
LAWDFAQDINRALDFYIDLGVDGIFTDFPLTVVKHFNYVFNNRETKCHNAGQSSYSQVDTALYLRSLLTLVAGVTLSRIRQ